MRETVTVSRVKKTTRARGAAHEREKMELSFTCTLCRRKRLKYLKAAPVVDAASVRVA